MQRNVIIVIVIIILIILGFWLFAGNDSDNVADTSPTATPTGEVDGESVLDEEFEFAATLADVSGGNATGTAMARFENGVYTVAAQFENLPVLAPGFFYEGWVVKKDPLDPVSTGKVTFGKGGALNIFTSSINLTDYTEYVLTLEPDDGDPAPAKHILEGTFTN